MVRSPDVDAYINASQRWPDEIAALREILLGCGLSESIKWRKPCYDADGANIVIVQEMKDFLALMFFKGALLDDPAGVLRDQGPNSRSARRIEFRSVDDITALADEIPGYVARAIEIEASGATVEPAPAPDLVPELIARFAEQPALEVAFRSLTPGRQREYHLHFAGAKQASTRSSRIDKVADRILAGKGMRDR